MRSTDVVSRKKRSEMMSGITARDTKPELTVRRGLHAKGFRFRLHYAGLPGKPDLVFPKFQAVIFVNGCFWHGHGCHLFKWPSSRSQFWKEKISGTVKRDERNLKLLADSDWRTLTIWECALKGRTKLPEDNVIDLASNWLVAGTESGEITGGEDVSDRCS